MGRPKEKLPEDEVLRELLRSMSQADIARRYGCTRAAVSAAVQRAKLAPKRDRYDDIIPWRVKVEHQRDYALRMLRLYARRENGKQLEPRDERYLERWLEALHEQDAVVDYHPDEGFYYTKRRDGVDKDVIREPAWRLEPGPKK